QFPVPLPSPSALPFLFALVSPSSRIVPKLDASSARPRRVVLRGRELLSAHAATPTHAASPHPPSSTSPPHTHTTCTSALGVVDSIASPAPKLFPDAFSPLANSLSWTSFLDMGLSTQPRHRATTSMNMVAQMRPWPAQEKTVYTTVHSARPRSPPVPTTTWARSWEPERGRVHPYESASVVDSLTPDKLTKLGFLGSRAPAYLVPTLVTVLDSPPLQAQAARARAPPGDRLIAVLTGRCGAECHGVYALSTIAHDVLG
ncbi:hypothetical protein B0H13DRAFT_2456401, partial [Mycena leptocephala]